MKTLKYGDKGPEVEELQRLLNSYGATLLEDGDFGNKTREAVKDFQNKAIMPITGIVDEATWNKLGISPIEDKVIYSKYDWTPVIVFESGGKEYYNKVLKKVTWPGGQSGLTAGIGADFGYLSHSEYDTYFKKYFTLEQNTILRSIIGLKGQAAKNKLSLVKDIELSWDNACKLFQEWTLPKFWKLTAGIWPGFDKLCSKATVALVSIVFNRGSSLIGDSRREMKTIQGLIPKKDYTGIAAQIRSMKRLWIGQGLDGLLKRREEEAKMVESCR